MTVKAYSSNLDNSHSTGVDTNEIGEINELLTNLEINPTITYQVARLKSLNLNEITELKQLVESELLKFSEILQSQNIDMDTQLVTEDGYPRGDIDVLQIRIIRRNINMLKNDLSNIIEQSFHLLNTHFKDLNKPQDSLISGVNPNSTIEYKIPFAIIKEINVNGPISSAGIQNDDKLISLGNIHAGNHMKLKSLINEVIQNEDKELDVRVLRRDQEIVDLVLIPTRKWNGTGLLGCKLQEL
ncbi:Nas2p PWA37_000422 [Arxiozyma heterogenica]|uniref:Probable 26S proteasome regulatory subunit p27 n=1 Tax=Arxiozyma heterogenica TaxID=278026 RepID=A0AAN7WF08_9SACH|nr:hypothetical protein RI543_003989 [Kazachstania heterogenica]